MADGRKIPYLIELAVDDKKIRQQMAKINWEELLGSKGKGFGDVLVSDAKEAKDQIKRTLGGLDIDWSKILGAKEIGQLEQAVTKALSKSRKEIELFAASGDTTGLEKTIKYVSALGDELKGLGSNFDAASLARGMGAFMKVLTPLTAKFEALADEPKRVEAAFDKLFSGISTSAKSVDLGKAFDVSGKIKIAMQGLKATNDEILEATESLEKYRNTVAKLSGDNPATIKLAQDIAGLNQQLDEQMRKEEQLASQNKTNSAQYAATLKNIMAIENARLKLKEKPTKDYAGMEIREDFGYYEEQINKVVERISKKMTEVEEKLANTVDKSFAEIISKQISDIKLSVSLSEQAENQFVDEINTFVKKINQSPIEKVKIQIGDVGNIIEDKQVRTYSKNKGDDDANTTALVKKTEERLDRVAEAINKKLTTNEDSILEKTKAWRKQMLDQFKFNKGDFEFKFNNALVDELQSLFDEYGLKINIDPTYLADQIKTVLEGSSVSLGGGTASIDPSAMASAVMAGVRAALVGESLTVHTPVNTAQERIPDATEQVATEIEQTAKHLDIAEEYVQDVVKKIKAVAKYAVKPADKDTIGTKATREQFKLWGVDLEKVLGATDDAQIAKMLENSLLKRGDFNKLVGSTVIDELSTFKGSSSNTISTFVESLREMFYMLQEDTETVDEWTRKKNSREIFDYARGRATAANSLRDVRSPIRTDKIPDIEYIDKAIAAMSAIGRNTDSLEALRLAREKLGSKTDEQSIQEFNAVANDFYKSTTKVFYDIKKQAEDAFKGTVYLQGSKKGVVKRQDIQNYKQLARVGDDDVILDIRVTSSLNNVVVDTEDRIPSFQAKKLLDGKRGDYIVSPEYEKDILRRELEYGGFKPQGEPTTDVNLDATLEANTKKREALMAEIKANEEEKKLLREQIDAANKQIADLTAKNDAIPQSRKNATQKKISEREALSAQLANEIFWLEEQVGNGKDGDDKKVGSLTKEIEEQLGKRASAERQLAELSELNVERQKKSLANAITEIESKDIPRFQQDLEKAQIKYRTADADKVLAQIEVLKAQSALKAIPKGKTNDVARVEATERVNKANRELARSTEAFEVASKDVDSITSQIENSKRKIENLQSQISETTLESIRQEQITRIQAINNVITSLEEEFAKISTEKAAKEAELLRSNKSLERARNDVVSRTQRELDDAVSAKNNLSARDRDLDASTQTKQDEVYRLELLNQRVEAEKEYNVLQEKSMVLQGSIKKMEKDGATEDTLSDKRTELEKINAELTKSLEKVQSLGGFLAQREVREYSDAERKAYALDQIQKIDNDLITARAQKNVVAARISKKDKEIAEVDRWGLGAGIGARALNQEKYKATSEFMNSDYVRSLIDTAREQTKNSIAEAVGKSELAETEALRAFNEKVADAMTKDGLNPHSAEQTQAFLKTTRGKQYSEDYNAEIASIQNSLQESTRELWSAYDERVKTIRSQVSAEFKEGMKVDNGVLSYVSKIRDESGEWVNELVEVYVRDALKKRLTDAKEILEEEQTPMQSNIDRLYADRKTAIEYGGVGDKEILSADVIEDQIRKQTELDKLLDKRADKEKNLKDLEMAGVQDSDDSVKQANKEIERLDKEIARYEMLIRNRKKLVELRWDENKADSYTDEEKELHFTEQVVGYNQKIEDSLVRQENLKQKIANASEEEKTKLQYQLAKEEENVAKWRKSISTTEGKLQKIETAKSVVATSEASNDSIVSLMKEALGSAGVDLTPVTEILNKILEILNTFKTEGIKKGGTKDTSEEKSKQPKKTEADLIRDGALKQHDVVRGLAAGRGSLYNQYMRDVDELNKAVEEANTASEKDKKKAIAKVKTKAQKVSTLSYNILKNTSQWDYLVANSDSGAKNLYLKQGESLKDKMETMAKKEHGILGKRGGELKNPKYKYDFLGFDGDTLTYQLTDIEGKTRKVTMVWNEFNKQVAITSDKTGSKLSELAGKIESFGEKFKDAIDSGYLGTEDKDLKRFQDAIAKINTEIAKGASFADVDKLRNEALRVADEVTKKVAKNKRAYTGTTEINAVTRQRDNMDARGILGRDDIVMVEQYNKAYGDLIKKYDKFKANGTLFKPENQKTLQNMAIQVKNLGKELEKSYGHLEELQRRVENSGDLNGRAIGDLSQIKEGTNVYEAMRAKLEELGATNIKIDKIHQRATGTIRHNNRTVSDLEVSYHELTSSLARYQKQERESLTGLPAFLNGFQKKFNSIMQYLTMTMSIHQVMAQLRRGVQYIKEIDLALTELRKVTDETEATYEKFLQTAAKTGERLGSTISAVTEATATFAKLGYSMAQATEMAEAAIVYKNVGDNIASTEDAADSIISTMKGFGLEATESMAIVDKFNEVGNRFAITSQGIGEALRLSASALNEGKNSLDESIALITAANEVVNDPSSVGTALKTLTLRLRGSKTELEEMGEDISDMATTTSQLQAKLLALTGGKVDIMLDANTFKNTTQILREMADAWEDMNDIQRASALELMGGKRQANTLSALIQNFETVEEAIEASAKSAGSALEENERYLDSIQGRIDQFNNALQSMWNNVLDDDLVKFIVQAGTELLKFIDNLGVVKTLIIGIGTYLIQKNFKGDLFGGLFNAQSIDEAKDRLKNLKNEIATLQGKEPSARNNRKINRKQEQANVLGASISKYDELSEKLKKLRVDTDGAKKALDDYNQKLANKAAKGKKITDAEIAKQTELNAKYNESQVAVEDTEKALLQAEVQAKATGTAGLNAGNKIKTGFVTAGKAVWKFAKEMAMSMAYTMAFTAIFEAIGNIGSALAPLFDKIVETPEELQEKLSELQNELSSVESELNSLQSELKDTDERIEELISQGSLTFVEQEELNKLKSVSAELKAQIGLQETLRKSLQQSTNSASVEATNAYLDTSFMSEKSKTERQEKAKETGSSIGQIIGTVAGGIIGTIIGGGITLASGGTAAVPGAAIGIAAGSAVAGWIGGEAGSAIAGSSYDSEKSVGEAMDSMLETRAKLKEEQDKALAENDVESYNEATEALRAYDTQMSKHISQIQQNYNAMDWEFADPETRKEMMEYADWLDAYNISMGTDGAKSNAIDRIFGDEAEDGFAKAKSEIDTLKKNLTEAQKSGKGVDEALAALEGFELNLSEEEVERLRSMGIYLYEVENYFKDVAKTESEFIDSDLEDVAKDINKITDGLGSLKSAFEEVIEEGVLTAKTVMALKEELKIDTNYADVEGVTDAWREYLDIMMSGTATTEEMTKATEGLAQAIIEAALEDPNGLTPETKGEYIAQLRSLGVTNAEEYIDDMLQKNMTKDLEGKVSTAYQEALKAAFAQNTYTPTDLVDEVFGNLSDTDLAKLAEEYDIVGEISADTITEMAEAYGTSEESIRGIIENLNEQQKLEANIAKYRESQDKYRDFEKSWSEKYQDWKTLQKTITDTYGVFTEAEKNFSTSGWSLSADGRNYVNVWKNQTMSKEDYEQLRQRNADYQKLINSDTYAEWKKLHDELVVLQNSEEGKLWLNPDLTLKDGVDADFEKKINEIKDRIKGIADEVDEELTANIELKLELQDKSELVDEMQEIYDALANAEKEYNENGGYVSVDTLQSLLQLEPKYLAMLYDENGQLNLNKQTILQVAQARTLDMGIQAAQNVITQASEALEANKINRLRELTEVTYNQADANWTLVESNLAALKSTIETRNADVNDEMYGQLGGVYEGIESQVFAIRDLTDRSVANIQNSFSSAGNTAKAEAEDAFQKAMDYWENRIGANQSLYEQIQNDIDLLEKKGQIAGESYYQAQMNVENERLAHLKEQRKEATDFLKKETPGTERWWEIANVLNDIEGEIDDVTLSLQDLKDAMDQVHWTIFDEAHERMGDLTTQLSNVREILSADEDSFFTDEGEWTETGVAVLGTYVQEIELYKNALADINKELENIDIGDFDSEQEYYDKLTELTNQQHEYTMAISDSEQSVVDMYESSVDAIEEYTQTLVESYNDYIDSVKEALDAERDLYDFKKNVQKQSKDIAEIERRIASLSGSTNKSDIAERRKLEAQLYESRESLNDTYYDHAKDSQQNALDSEREAYEENMNKFVEGLRISLEEATRNMDEFLMSVTSMVTLNADTVLAKYESTELPLSTTLTNPWEAAKAASNSYSGNALDLLNQWTKEDGFFAKFNTSGTTNLTSPWNAGKTAAQGFASSIQSTMSSVYNSINTNVQNSITSLNALKAKYAEINDEEVRVNTGGGGGGGGGGYVAPAPTPDSRVRALQEILKNVYYKNVPINGIWDSATESALKVVQKTIGVSQTGKYDYNTERALENNIKNRGQQSRKNGYSSDAKFYEDYWRKVPAAFHAKGTTGTTRDEWAITDEPQFGDELTMYATPEGTLSFMRAGSTVIPADLTRELIDLPKVVDGLINRPKFDSGINMIANAINKPEIVIDMENFLKVDRVDKDTLPQLEAMMDKKIDTFAKQLNYSIKKFAR